VDKVATDDRAQLAYYRKVGYFGSTPEPYADLGEIVTGRSPGRETQEERTLSLNLGLAIEDVATARLIFRKAVESGVGRELPL
jgi:ornithine cyclodeaminase/alanine dehydrogenase